MELINLKSTQPKVAQDIKAAFDGGYLPQSLLFMGTRGTSRLTAALDLAFILTGEEKRRDVLGSGNIVYFPHRDFLSRIKASIAMFENERTYVSRHFLIESTRLVLLQYHSSISGFSPAAARSLFTSASEIDEMLSSYEEDRDYSENEVKELCSFLKKRLVDDTKLLYFGKKGPTPVNIDSIRGIEEWFSSGSDEKVVIIEDIEDATDGARNSLLKTLEEPPLHSHIILVSSNPQKIMETILSRVRKYSFTTLSKKTVSSLIAQRFRTSGDFTSFDSFFFQKGAGEDARNELEKDVQVFVNAILGGRPMTIDEENDFLLSLEKLSATRYFRERVGEEIERSAVGGRTSAAKARKVMNLVNSWIQASEIYNLSDKSSFDLMLREASLVK